MDARTWALAWALLSLAACGKEMEMRASSTPPPPQPTPWILEAEIDAPSPALDSAAVAAALLDGVRQVVLQNPARVRALLDALLAEGDEGCPPRDVYEEAGVRTIAFVAECAAASGTRFDGELNYGQIEGGVREDGATLAGFTLYGGGLRIEAPDGRFFAMSGYRELYRASQNGTDDGHFYLSGSIRVDTVSAAGDPWLMGELRGEVGAYAFAGPEGGRFFGVNGSTNLSSGGAVAIAVQELQLGSFGPCASEPAGVASIREANGVWHDVLFDGRFDEDTEPNPAACDGCGQHLVDGDPSGEVCLDRGALTGLLAWDGFPW